VTAPNELAVLVGACAAAIAAPAHPCDCGAIGKTVAGIQSAEVEAQSATVSAEAAEVRRSKAVLLIG
jgi:hypothetical protein